MEYAPSVKVSLGYAGIVQVVAEVGDRRATYVLDAGESEMGTVLIHKVQPIFVFSGDYLERITIRIKGRVPHSYARVDNDYTIYANGAFLTNFSNVIVERLDEDNNDAR